MPRHNRGSPGKKFGFSNIFCSFAPYMVPSPPRSSSRFDIIAPAGGSESGPSFSEGQA